MSSRERDNNKAFLAWFGLMVIGFAAIMAGLFVAVCQQVQGAYNHLPLFFVVVGFFLFTFSMARAK